MSASLDVRHAIHEANRVFCRYPVRICLPMILFGVVSYAVTPFLTPGIHLYWLYILIDGLGTFWLVSLVEVVVASMCLRALEGTEPGAAQVSEALHYRGFGALLWGLLLRYVGWGLLLGLGGGVAAILSSGIYAAVAPVNGISAGAGGGHLAGIAIGAIVGVVFVTLIFCRYMFVLPMFVIARTSGPGFLDDCVRRTLQVWKTAALVLVAGTAPAFALTGIEFPLTRKDLTQPTFPHGAHLAIQLIGTLVMDCYAAWFILLKTGLAVQLISAQPESPSEPSAKSATGLADGLVL